MLPGHACKVIDEKLLNDWGLILHSFVMHFLSTPEELI